MRTALAVLAGSVLTLGVVGGFMAVDKTQLHWYVEQTDAEHAAAAYLGDWDRSVPERIRAEGRDEFLRTGVDAPGSESSEQLNYALFRIANMSALPLIGEEMSSLETPRQQLERLHECIGFLLANHDSATACNLQSLAR